MARRRDIDQIREDRRAEILAVACRLFATRGVTATGLVDIAREIGISHTTIYLYFKSKEELLAAVLATGFAQIRSLLQEPLSRADLPPLERLRQAMRAMMRPTREDTYFLVVGVQVYTLARDLPEPLVAPNAETEIWLRSAIMAIIEEGQRAGTIRAGDSRLLTDMVTDMMMGHFVYYSDHDYPWLDSLIDSFITMLAAR